MQPFIPSRCGLCGFALLAATMLPVAANAQSSSAPPLPIHATLIDDDAIAYATFQSHNQKVVSNRKGIFASYIRSGNKDYNAQEWRLAHSRDGSKTFSVMHQATHATNPPILETDEQDNVYLVRPDFKDGHAYLYRFSATAEKAEPVVTKIPGGSAGKYSMTLDAKRKQLYFFAHNNTFHVIGLDGTVRSSATLLKQGPNGAMVYPHLALARDGTLFAAWTTQKHGVYLYWDIHAMKSPDAGKSWQKLDGTPLELPVIADETGKADRISRDDEFKVHSWLSAFLAANGKLHLAYWTENTPQRQRYLRYDGRSGKQEVDTPHLFRGRDLKLVSDSGVLVARAELADAPLYFVSAVDNRTRLACLASDNNGATWYEYALGDQQFRHRAYSIGAARELTRDGSIIGTFTDVAEKAKTYYEPKSGKVYFFRIQAGRSSATVAKMSYTDGTLRLTFDQARGQPKEIRFRSDGDWSAWQPFQKELTVKIAPAPRQYQLKSRLDVASPPRELGNKAP